MRQHDLKILIPYFEEVIKGNKTFEVRKNDRDYQLGDILALKEFERGGGHTGREVKAEVTYMMKGGQFGLQKGWAILSIKLKGKTTNEVS